MKTKIVTTTLLVAMLVLAALFAAGCGALLRPGNRISPAGQVASATAELTDTATPEPTLTWQVTRTPRPTQTPALSSTLFVSPAPTSTRTPRPTATRWVVARLTATAQALGAATVTPSLAPKTSTVGGSARLVGKLVFQLSSGGEIYTIDVDGRDLRLLTHGLDPAWSPDGKQVAFTRWEGERRGLWVIDADGAGEELLYGRDLLKEPDWSPDGRSIVFSVQEGGREEREVCFPPWGCFTIPADPYWRLALVDAIDRSYRDLSSDLHSHSATIDPLGTRVIYAGDRGIQSTSLMETDERLIREEESRISSPAISPDGDRIVYMIYLHDHWDLFMTTSDGLNRARLTRTSALEPRMANYVAPAWSPDGKHIAFLSDRDGEWRLYVMNADGSEQRLFLPAQLAELEFTYDFANERVVDWGP